MSGSNALVDFGQAHVERLIRLGIVKNRIITQDGRYIIANGVLYRTPNPNLTDEQILKLSKIVSLTRKEYHFPRKGLSKKHLRENLRDVEKDRSGEIWWTDGAPDYNRTRLSKSPYYEWYLDLIYERVY